MELNTPNTSSNRPYLTIEEYLHFEDSTIEKHEYYQGEVYARGLCNLTHNKITVNTLATIHQMLNSIPAQLHTSALRIFIEKISFFTYPDISIFCDEVITRNNDEMNATNPSVLIEVCSPVTRNYDKGFKFELYQEFDSLKEYVTIDSEKINVDVSVINSKCKWESIAYHDITETITISTLNIEIPLQTIYKGTALH